jgi:hypothetical protein
MPGPLPAEGTLLILSGIGIPLYSARGLKQTLTPVPAAQQVRRTINMEAVDLSLPVAKKYDTTISASDVAPPAFDNIWPGMQVTINCVAELQYPVGGTPSRTVVSGSSVTLGSFVKYRPQLVMIITGLSTGIDEWKAGREWQLTATEA